MARKLYDSNGRLVGEIVHISVETGVSTKVTLKTGHTLFFDADAIAWDDKYNGRIRKSSGYHNDMVDNARYMTQAKKMLDDMNAVTAARETSIRKVIFNSPATVVYWSDGTKTVVKCSVNDKFDPEKGLAMAIAKRCANNSGSYYKEIQKWVGEESCYKANFADMSKEKATLPADNALLKKYVDKADADLKSFVDAATTGDATKVMLIFGALNADLELLKTAINK